MKSSDSAYIAAMLSEDSGLKLLRTKNAALTISFLYKIFREKHIQTISAERFETLLADFLRDNEFSNTHYDFDSEESDNGEVRLAMQTIETALTF